jgi:Protein of unknown function (DUF1320)
MAFLVKSELTTVADPAIINLITGVSLGDDAIVNACINEGISMMKSFLSRYYDVAAIFNATGDARDLTVLHHLKNIVIHEIWIRHTRKVNEVAKLRFDEAMNWLEKLNEGKFIIKTLPPVPGSVPSPSSQDNQDVRFGVGNSKYENIF